MPAIGVTQIGSRTSGAARTERVSPPALPSAQHASMRVTKVARPVDPQDDELAQEWQRRAAETRARIAEDEEREWRELRARAAAEEEREWRELIVRAKAATQAAEAAEWQAARAHAAEQSRLAEEREWQALMARARSVPAPANDLLPWSVQPAPMAKVAPRVVAWP